jgi:uncharacterized protein YggE
MTDRNNSSHDPTGTSATSGSLDPTNHPGRGSAMWTVLVVVLVLLVVVTVAAVAFNRSGSSTKATISVTGSGTVQGTPDTVSFQVGVQNVGASAVAALTQNNARVGALEKTLLAHGVAKKDMQTSGLDIYENTNSGGVVTGFTVADYLNVTMHQVKKAGGAIDAAAQVAGNGTQLSGITFSISNESKLLASARAKAMRNAHTEAAQVARGGNTSLGSIVKITDQENSTPTNVFYPSFANAKATSSAVPIQAGSESITVQVSVVYALTS